MKMITFASVFFLVTTVVRSDGHDDCTNVAEGGLAVAGSISNKGKALYLVDGKTENGAECYNSAPRGGHHRVKVFLKGAELGIQQTVESVTLFAYDNTVKFAKVYVDRHQCGEVGQDQLGSEKYEISCGGVKGSVVSVLQVQSSSLRLCEVQVWAKTDTLPDVPVGENIALKKAAKQSDRTRDTAGLANDGNRNKWLSGKSCTIITREQNRKWWEVELGGTKSVGQVVLHGSMDRPNFINAARVYVISSTSSQPQMCGAVNYQSGDPPVHMIDCQGLEGDKVRVTGPPERNLILCEVEVYEVYEPPSETNDED